MSECSSVNTEEKENGALPSRASVRRDIAFKNRAHNLLGFLLSNQGGELALVAADAVHASSDKGVFAGDCETSAGEVGGFPLCLDLRPEPGDFTD